MDEAEGFTSADAMESIGDVILVRLMMLRCGLADEDGRFDKPPCVCRTDIGRGYGKEICVEGQCRL